MKPNHRIILALGCGLALFVAQFLFATGKFESIEPVVLWSMPLFHKVFPPWASGPNPLAAMSSFALNSALFTCAVWLVLRQRRRRSQDRPSVADKYEDGKT